MKKIPESSQFFKIISVFLIFVLLIQFTGCYSFKPISWSDTSISQTDKYRYIIHTEFKDYALKNPIISNGTLTGNADFEKHSYRTKAIKLYPKPNYFWITIDTLNTISIPLDSIAKFKKSKFSIIKTIAIPLIPIIIIWIAFSTWELHMRIEPHISI
jgi:hypothetical protein